MEFLADGLQEFWLSPESALCETPPPIPRLNHPGLDFQLTSKVPTSQSSPSSGCHVPEIVPLQSYIYLPSFHLREARLPLTFPVCTALAFCF